MKKVLMVYCNSVRNKKVLLFDRLLSLFEATDFEVDFCFSFRLTEEMLEQYDLVITELNWKVIPTLKRKNMISEKHLPIVVVLDGTPGEKSVVKVFGFDASIEKKSNDVKWKLFSQKDFDKILRLIV